MHETKINDHLTSMQPGVPARAGGCGGTLLADDDGASSRIIAILGTRAVRTHGRSSHATLRRRRTACYVVVRAIDFHAFDDITDEELLRQTKSLARDER